MNSKLIYPYGLADAQGILKSEPSDFRVTENLGFEPTGEGEHLFLFIEKIQLTTPDLIEILSRDFGLKARNIGYSGLKDKQAITRQWFSLHLPGQMHSFEMPTVSGYKILQHGWHHRKLKSGSHRSNSFEVIIREIEPLSGSAQGRIDSIKDYGMANYFGEQRFGARADNVSRAVQVFSHPDKTKKLSRTKKSLYLSSLRSYLYNQILSNRIAADIWREPIEGDVFMLSGSQSVFQAPISTDVLARYQSFDIASTTSLAGEGDSKLCGAASDIEAEVFGNNKAIIDCLFRMKVKRHLRSIRVQVANFEVSYQSEDKTLSIKATLPRGSYFTTLLDHFVAYGSSG